MPTSFEQTDWNLFNSFKRCEMSTDLMKKQWNEMAGRNPFFSITSWPEFERPEAVDMDYFWEIGRIHAVNLLEKVNLPDTQRMVMVEIGCGIGRMTHYFARCFQEVYAFDISSEMLENARGYWSHLKNVHFIEGSGEDLKPLPAASADFVFSFYVLNHVTEPETVLKYLAETARVLKPAGFALLHFRIRRASLLQRLRDAVRPKQAQPKFLWWNKGI